MEVWTFEKVEERPDVYVDLKGQEIDMSGDTAEVRDDLAELIRFYNDHPPYTQFKTFWHAFDSPISVHLDGQSPCASRLFAIAKDLEKRIGISQGRVRP